MGQGSLWNVSSFTMQEGVPEVLSTIHGIFAPNWRHLSGVNNGTVVGKTATRTDDRTDGRVGLIQHLCIGLCCTLVHLRGIIWRYGIAQKVYVHNVNCTNDYVHKNERVTWSNCDGHCGSLSGNLFYRGNLTP